MSSAAKESEGAVAGTAEPLIVVVVNADCALRITGRATEFEGAMALSWDEGMESSAESESWEFFGLCCERYEALDKLSRRRRSRNAMDS